MAGVKIEVLGDVQYDRAFLTFEHELGDMHEPLGHVRDLLVHHVTEQFDTQGAWAAGGWAQLNPGYERWKAAHYPGRGILQRTGTLRDQLVEHGTLELTDRRLVYGIDPGVVNPEDDARVAEYGAAHQTGSGVPQRKIINLRADERRGIDREFVEFINHVRHRLFPR